MEKTKECRHKWRMGSGIGAIVNGKIISKGRNAWCEKCNKKIIVHYFSDDELSSEIAMVDKLRDKIWRKMYRRGKS